MPKPYSVFISYSHEDMKLRRELDEHLSTLRNEGIISTWTDSDISPGTEWEPQIIEKLNSAQIILLLVSKSFVSSKFCSRVEMKLALNRHEGKIARVVPIILRPVFWEIGPLSKLQALPLTAKKKLLPVTSWPQHDDAWKNIVLGIHTIAKELEQEEKRLIV